MIPRLVDARWVIPPLRANCDRSRRSLSCAECRRPIPAGQARCRGCADDRQRYIAVLRTPTESALTRGAPDA